MNEQVKRLMGQALDKKFSHTWIALDHQDLEKFSDYFAELLVKECICSISKSLEAANINLSSRPNDDYWLGFRHACDDHLTELKEHFGVE